MHVTCDEIHARIARGEKPMRPEEVAHIGSCAGCQLLVADQGALARDLSVVRPESNLDLGDLGAAISQSLAKEHGPSAFLRSRSTGVRYSIAYGILVAVSGGVGLLWLRPDFSVYPLPRMVGILAVLLLLGVTGVWLALRPLFRRPLSTAWGWTLFWVLLCLPWLFALLPVAHLDHPAALRGTGDGFWAAVVVCLAVGIGLALPLLILLWLLDRNAFGSAARALVAAGTAGALGNIGLQLHCAITAPSHLAVGHALVGVLFATAVATLWFLRSGRSR